MKLFTHTRAAQESLMAKPTEGHRQRLRDRFLSGEGRALTEESLIELLLTFAIPQKDVRPLAVALLERCGSLQAILDASPETLRQVPGIGDATVVLLKLVGHLTRRDAVTPRAAKAAAPEQPHPTRFPTACTTNLEPQTSPTPAKQARVIQRPRTGLFSNGLVKETIAVLPELPDTESIEAVRNFLRDTLHFNSAKTRQRCAAYISRRMFPLGVVDKALRLFAKKHAGSQALRDVCFYRFVKAEPMMGQFIWEVIAPALGHGLLPRTKIHQFLLGHFSSAKPNSLKSTASAIVEVLVSTGLTRVEKTKLTFQPREVCVESFAFILHSEFPEPGMYDVGKIESSPVFQTMLWRPDKLVPALYELRNRGLISKVSEIDQVRQFTTRYDLDGLVEMMVSQGGPP